MSYLLQADIIPQQADQLWQELPADWQGPAGLLLLSRPLETASPAYIMLQELAQRACGFKAGDFRILEIAPGSLLPWSQLKSRFQPLFVFLFGIQPAELGIQARLTFNFPNRFGGATMVPTYDAAQMAENKILKNELWINALKGLFQK